MSRGKGYRRDTHFHSPSAKPLFGARRGLPPSADLSQFVSVAEDQDGTSACVEFATAMALFIRAKYLLTPIEMPSRLALYAAARAYERRMLVPKDAPPDYELPPLADVGTEPSLMAQALLELGSCPESLMPFDPTLINEEPKLGVLEEMAQFQFRGSYAIDTLGTERSLDVCQALSEGFPVTVPISTDRAWDEYGKDSPPLGAADPGDQRGGHMTLLLDYWHDPVTGELRFRGLNAWGDGVHMFPWSNPDLPPWGKMGFFEATPAWLEAPLTDSPYVWTMQTTKVAR